MIAAFVMILPLCVQKAEARQTEQQLDVHAQRVLIRGLTWIQNGYPDRAAAVFEEGLKIHPDNSTLLGAMAQAHQDLGDFGTARFYLDQALLQQTHQPELVAQDLALALMSADGVALELAVDRLLALSEPEPSFLLRQADFSLAQGATDVTATLLLHAQALYPENLDTAIASVAFFKERGELDTALISARKVAQSRGLFEDQMAVLELQIQLGRWNDASDTALPLLKIDPEDDALLAIVTDLDARLPDRNLALESGISLEQASLPTQAAVAGDSLSVLRAAWMAAPDDEMAVVDLVNFLIRSGEATEAALLADEHVAVYPRHLSLWSLSIEAWLAAGDLEAATIRADDAVALFPGYPPIVMAHAKVLSASGDRQAAAQAIDDLLERLESGSPYLEAARELQSRFLQPQ